MKRFELICYLLAAWSASTGLLVAQSAQSPVGTVIRGFVLPQRNADGEPEANLTGDEARVLTLNRTEVTNLRVELFDEGKVSVVMTTPLCDLWRDENRLESKAPVQVNRDNLEIKADQAIWYYRDKKGVFRGNVKLVISRFEFGAKPKGGDPSDAAGSSILNPIPTNPNP